VGRRRAPLRRSRGRRSSDEIDASFVNELRIELRTAARSPSQGAIEKDAQRFLAKLESLRSSKRT
jgi:hypothetical protein